MSTTNFVKSFRGRTTVYWVTTLLLALECLVGGIMGALQRPTFIDIMKHLGYPDYVMTIIGVWYVLDGVALLVPGFPLLKEWAYAGLFFIYTGAIASRLAVGDGVVTLVGPIILTGLVIASWTWRPSTRRLDDSSI
jgi:DoxX-like family